MVNEPEREPDGKTAQYAAALRALYVAAGEPPLATLVRQAKAQRPPLSVSDTSLSDWLNGKYVPSDPATAAFLITWLRGRAKQKTPGFEAPPDTWWTKVRADALVERRTGRGKGGRPARSRPSFPRREHTTRHWVGVIPRIADGFQDRQATVGIDSPALGGGTAPACQMLTGMGGVGKTQLAASYARRAWEAGEVDLLVWVSAASRQAIIVAYTQAGIEATGAAPPDQEWAAAQFLTHLEMTDQRWLVVLDDVANPADLRGLWPPARVGGRVLVTTRRRDAALTGQGRRFVEVGLFTPDESTAYINAKLDVHDVHDDPDQIAALAKDLGYLPLALAQAITYLIDAGINCAAYRQLLADRRGRLAELLPDDSSLPDDYHATVAATWAISIERANRLRPQGVARPILALTAMLDPNGIPQGVLTAPVPRAHMADFRNHGNSEGDYGKALDSVAEERSQGIKEVSEQEAYDALRCLHRLNLVDHDPAHPNKIIRVHQLLQRVVRESLTTVHRVVAVQAAYFGLAQAWPHIDRDTVLAEMLRTNTVTVTSHTSHPLQSPVLQDLLWRTGHSLGTSGQVAKALSHFGSLYEMVRHEFGDDHPDALNVRLNLAHWQGESGDVTGAIDSYRQLLDDLQRSRGPDHQSTLSARYGLARWTGEAGDAAAAVEMFQQLLEDYLRTQGPNHRDTLAVKGSLAYWTGMTGDVARAVKMYGPVVNERQRLLGRDHPDTLAARHNLARLRGEAGDIAGAIIEFQHLINDLLRVLGPDHPSILAARQNHADLNAKAGNISDAITAYLELLKDRLRVLGPDHPLTLTARANLAELKGMAGDGPGTIIELRNVLADCVRVLGLNHPLTQTVRDELTGWKQQVYESVFPTWEGGETSR